MIPLPIPSGPQVRTGSETEATHAATLEARTVPRATARDGGAHGAAEEHHAVRGGPRDGVLAVVPHRDVRQQLLEVGVGDGANPMLGFTAGLAVRPLSPALGGAHLSRVPQAAPQPGGGRAQGPAGRPRSRTAASDGRR